MRPISILLAGLGLMSCYGDGGGGGGGSSTCRSAAAQLRGCGLLSEGDAGCDQTPSAEVRCRMQCFAESNCTQLRAFFCESDPDSATARCTESCADMHAFTCGDGDTLPEDWRCDGVADCADGSDELGCAEPPGFTCGDGETLPSDWRCDGESDCADGSDEMGCPTFACGDGETVPAPWQCDGEVDCADGSDELDCPEEAQLTCE